MRPPMADAGKCDPLRLGFFTAIAVPERGFVGGLLVTNHLGRPLEFQCTAPVRPNRTQEILYGPPLPRVDAASLLDLGSHVEIAVAFVASAPDGRVTRDPPACPGDLTLTVG